MEISGKTKLCALIGDPVEHSLSPAMHNAAFKHLGLNYVYLAFKVERERLKEAIAGVKALKIHGLNVTKPLKIDVIPLLDELHESASKVGAVNTILNRDGKLVGYNTDSLGGLKALENAEVDLNGIKVVIFGAGGAARAAAFSIAPKVGEVVLLNRTVEKAERLAHDLEEKLGCKARFGGLREEVKRRELRDADLVINATSVGMRPNENLSLVNPDLLGPDLAVFELVYNPVETKLLKDARKAGSKVIDGLSLLLHQGVESFSIWTGVKPPIEVMRKALESALEDASDG